jgi:hypothetical protein
MDASTELNELTTGELLDLAWELNPQEDWYGKVEMLIRYMRDVGNYWDCYLIGRWDPELVWYQHREDHPLHVYYGCYRGSLGDGYRYRQVDEEKQRELLIDFLERGRPYTSEDWLRDGGQPQH